MGRFIYTPGPQVRVKTGVIGKVMSMIEETIDSAAVASFSDGADDVPLKALSAEIDPVQDLHGYDNPWPAGGGVNFMPPIPAGTYTQSGITAVVDAEGKITVTGEKTTAEAVSLVLTTYENPVTIPAGSYIHLRNSIFDTNIAFDYISNSPSFTSVNRIYETTEEKTGTLVKLYFSTAMTGTINFTLQPSIEATNSVTDWTPYENVCPISGRDEVTVTRTGKNQGKLSADTLGDNKNLSFSYSDSGAVLTVTDSYARSKYVFPTKIGETYTVSFGVLTDGNYRRIQFGSDPDDWADENQAYGNETPQANVQTQITKTFTSVGNQFVIGFYVSSGVNTGSMTITNFQLELGSAASDYEPYQGTSVTIELPKTEDNPDGIYYGGTLDVINGILTVDMMCFTADGTNIVATGTGSASGKAYYNFSLTANNLPESIVTDSTNAARFICSHLKCSGQVAEYDNFYVANSGKTIYCYTSEDDQSITAEIINTRLQTDPMQFCIPLAEPVTYNLKPEILNSLLGDNAVWADSGDVTVTYRADTKMYIDQQVAELQALILEN